MFYAVLIVSYESEWLVGLADDPHAIVRAVEEYARSRGLSTRVERMGDGRIIIQVCKNVEARGRVFEVCRTVELRPIEPDNEKTIRELLEELW